MTITTTLATASSYVGAGSALGAIAGQGRLGLMLAVTLFVLGVGIWEFNYRRDRRDDASAARHIAIKNHDREWSQKNRSRSQQASPRAATGQTNVRPRRRGQQRRPRGDHAQGSSRSPSVDEVAAIRVRDLVAEGGE